MKKSSASLAVPLAEPLAQAFRNRFILTVDLSIPLSRRLMDASIVDRGSFLTRSTRVVRLERRASHGIFRLHEVGEDGKAVYILRTIFRMPPKRKRAPKKVIPATTHELVDFGHRFAETVLERRIVSIGNDEFRLVHGEDWPRASVLTWSEEMKSIVITSEPLYPFVWQPSDSILLWA